MEPFIMLGIDPGTRVSGYSILRCDKQGQSALLDYGYLQMSSSKTIGLRIGEFYRFFTQKIDSFGISHVALETPFLGKNAQTFLKLGYLRGILYLLADQNGIDLYEFSPKEVKMSVVGYGGATKEQVATMILRLFPKLNEIGKIAKNDVTDALAVTICGLWHKRHDEVRRLSQQR